MKDENWSSTTSRPPPLTCAQDSRVALLGRQEEALSSELVRGNILPLNT